MEITIRDWNRSDLKEIQRIWLDYFQNVTRSDMQRSPDADVAMTRWLNERFRQPQTIGFVGEAGDTLAGFLIARIDDWESVPPVIKNRRIGIVDALYVIEAFRRRGVGSRLIDTALQRMRAANAIAVETVYDAWNDAAAEAWHRAGFAPWMVHAYRML
jgi:GNAT superfamily N-acetyltransferase